MCNGHFLRSPYQIYQHNLFYLLIIVINNCEQFSYCTLYVGLQLRDWLNRCVWGRFNESQNSKVTEIIEYGNRYVIYLLRIINT